MKKSLFLAVLAVAAAAGAMPSVSGVAFRKGVTPGQIIVDYVLDAGDPAIITFSIETNGVTVADARYAHAVGDVNHKVQPGARSFVWEADLDWPGHEISSPSVAIKVKAWSLNNPPDILIYNIHDPAMAPMYYASAADVPGGLADVSYKTHRLAMRRIHATGRPFRCGGLSTDPYYNSNMWPYPAVLTNDYYIGVYPITRRQYDDVSPRYKLPEAFQAQPSWNQSYLTVTNDYAESRPCIGPSPKYYLTGSSYEWPGAGNSVENYLFFYSLRNRIGNQTFRLPTRAEWEFAARAGSSLANSGGGSDTNEVDAIGWHAGNNADDPDWQEGLPHAVGLKKPNAWNLYDMQGNVWEWVLDRYDGGRQLNADGSPFIAPVGPASGANHILCGGSFQSEAKSCAVHSVTATDWGAGAVTYGFRVVCNVEVNK